MLMEHLFRLQDIEKKLRSSFMSSHLNSDVALTGILLARPEDRFTKDKILTNLKYWHLRSDNYVSFFCAGYAPYYHLPQADPIGIRFAGFEWAFSHEAFVEVLNALESQTGWRYDGNPKLILLNSIFDGQNAKLDYSHYLEINFKEAEKYSKEPTEIAESIFGFASSINKDTNNPLWEYSDKAGIRIIKSGFKDWLLSMLPDSLSKPTREALIYATHESRNVQNKQIEPKIKKDNNVIEIDFRK